MGKSGIFVGRPEGQFGGMDSRAVGVVNAVLVSDKLVLINCLNINMLYLIEIFIDYMLYLIA
jgi:hypothetical protein